MAQQYKQRCIDYCRRLRWLAGDVERRKQLIRGGQGYMGRMTTTVDLFGFADIVAIDPSRQGVLFIQATSYPQIRPHFRKHVAENEHAVRTALTAGNSVEIWGWRKKFVEGRGREMWLLTRCSMVLDSDQLAMYDIVRDEIPSSL